MLVSINQPAYLPWLGYYHRIAVSDKHIVLDHVQFEKGSFTNRNKVRTDQGACWLTVPVLTQGRFHELPINSVEIDNRVDWRSKHWKTLAANYSKCPYFDEHSLFFEDVYRREWLRLADLCEEMTRYFLKAFEIETPLLQSSQMQPSGVKDELVLDLCRKASADTYLSGALGRNYIREEIFNRQRIVVRYQDYQHPEYPQRQRGPFVPYMAAIDLLFNCGPESRNVILSGEAGE